MRFPSSMWAIRQRGSQFEFAAWLGESESWLSRRLNPSQKVRLLWPVWTSVVTNACSAVRGSRPAHKSIRSPS